MKRMMWSTGNLESRREFDRYYTWALRARLWAIVAGGGCAAVFILLYGPGRLPESVHIPVWLGGGIVAVIGVPFFAMLAVAFVHLVRADQARRREAKEGQVTYTNWVARWIDTHGVLLGLAVVALVVAASTWLTLHLSR
jgi:hypothetical protein